MYPKVGRIDGIESEKADEPAFRVSIRVGPAKVPGDRDHGDTMEHRT